MLTGSPKDFYMNKDEISYQKDTKEPTIMIFNIMELTYDMKEKIKKRKRYEKGNLTNLNSKRGL